MSDGSKKSDASSGDGDLSINSSPPPHGTNSDSCGNCDNSHNHSHGSDGGNGDGVGHSCK